MLAHESSPSENPRHSLPATHWRPAHHESRWSQRGNGSESYSMIYSSLSCTASPKIGLYSPRRTGIVPPSRCQEPPNHFLSSDITDARPEQSEHGRSARVRSSVSTHRRIQRDASNGVNWNDSTGHPDFCETVRIGSSHARPKPRGELGSASTY